MTRAVASGIRHVTDVGNRSVALSSAVGVPAVIGAAILAVPLLNTVFGPDYGEGAAAFRLLLLSIGFIFISGSIHNVTLVLERLQTQMWIVAAAAVFNVGLNLLLIPKYGLVGAAFTTAVSEGLILLIGLLVVYQMGVRLNLRPTLRVLLAAGLMGAALIIIEPFRQGLIANILFGIAVYLLALLLFRGVPPDLRQYMERLRSILMGLLGRFLGVCHFRVPQTTRQIDEAQRALAGRDYYQLYDDVYDAIRNAGGSREHESQMGLTNSLVHQHFEDLRSCGLIMGPGASLIDLGCGPGQNAVRFAQLGYRVTGVDISPTAIDMANHRASQENLNIDFRMVKLRD